MIDQHHGWNVSFKPLVIGFILSLILLAAAYRIATHYHLTNLALTSTLVGLAVLGAAFQLIFFLQLGLESRPRWNTVMFFFMLLLIVILVGGSMWIMHHLSYNLMLPKGGL